MKSVKIIFFYIILFLISNSCKKDKEIDKQKPLIDSSFQAAFPLNCDTLYFGESFMLKMLFSDNVELGSYSIDIHHNFDHHSHSTDVSACNLDSVKNPVNPFTFIEDYNIPEGLKEYEPNLSLLIPSGNGSGSFDTGDYHFFIRLTDKEGWSAQKGISVKILYR